MQRRAFGGRLADNAVVRFKLAAMIAAVEPVAHWVDVVTYQMNRMPYQMQGLRLAGTTSLLKYQATRASQLYADNAVQLWGGRGITKQGMGRYVEVINPPLSPVQSLPRPCSQVGHVGFWRNTDQTTHSSPFNAIQLALQHWVQAGSNSGGVGRDRCRPRD